MRESWRALSLAVLTFLAVGLLISVLVGESDRRVVVVKNATDQAVTMRFGGSMYCYDGAVVFRPGETKRLHYAIKVSSKSRRVSITVRPDRGEAKVFNIDWEEPIRPPTERKNPAFGLVVVSDGVTWGDTSQNTLTDR